MKIEIGQKWEVYSSVLRRWARAEVKKVQGQDVTLAYEDFPETLSADQWLLANSPRHFRLAVAH
jgi:hypothetical protein